MAKQQLSLANQLSIAIAIASEAHKAQMDRGGKPYILHPMRIMMKFQGDCKRMIVAILHDVVEDTDWTFDKLKKAGITNKDVLESLKLITKKDDVKYSDYIIAMYDDPMACAVKCEDIQDNSLLTRLKGVRPKDMTRALKYHAAYMYLSGRIEKDEFIKTLSDLDIE